MMKTADTFIGVWFSAALLLITGCMSLGLMAAPHEALSLRLLFVGVGAACFSAGAGVMAHERWAAYLATALGIVLICVGLLVFVAVLKPRPPSPYDSEDGFAIFFLALPSIAAGTWWCVYLNLAHVREQNSKGVS